MSALRPTNVAVFPWRQTLQLGIGFTTSSKASSLLLLFSPALLRPQKAIPSLAVARGHRYWKSVVFGLSLGQSQPSLPLELRTTEPPCLPQTNKIPPLLPSSYSSASLRISTASILKIGINFLVFVCLIDRHLSSIHTSTPASKLEKAATFVHHSSRYPNDQLEPSPDPLIAQSWSCLRRWRQCTRRRVLDPGDIDATCHLLSHCSVEHTLLEQKTSTSGT